MPTYDYECTKCHHRFEKFQAMSDPLLKSCPKCRGRVRRLIGGGAGLIFKGQGFHVTDYRTKDYRDKARADVAAPAPEKSGSGASSPVKKPPAGRDSGKGGAAKKDGKRSS